MILPALLLALAQDPAPPPEAPPSPEAPPRPERTDEPAPERTDGATPRRTDRPPPSAGDALPDATPWSGALPPTPEQVVAERESAALAEIEFDLFDAWLRREPWHAREVGRATYDAYDGQFSIAESTHWKNALDETAGRLLSVRGERLAPGRRIDHEWLSAWVHCQRLLIRILPPGRDDPAWYVNGVLRGVRSLVETDTPDATARLIHLTRRLHRVPEIWIAAASSTRIPDRALAQHAAEQAADLALYLDGLTPLIESLVPDPALRPVILEPRDEAHAATMALVQWLGAQVEVRDPGNRPIEARSWEALLRAYTGTELTLEELKVRLLRDMAELELSLGEDADLQHPEVPVTPAQAQALVERGMLLAARAGVLAAFITADAPMPSVRAGPAVMRGEPIAELHVGGANALALDVAMDAPHWPSAMSRTRRAMLSPAGLMALGIRYGPAGEAVLLGETLAEESRTRRLLPNEGTLGGFGLWTTEWSTRSLWPDSPIAGHPALVSELARQRLLEAARMYASLGLHGEGRPMGEVVLDLLHQTGLDPESAHFEVLEAMREPLRGADYVVYLELLRMEKELLTEPGIDPPAALRIVALALRQHPNARVADLRPVIQTPREEPRQRATAGSEVGAGGRAEGRSDS